MNALAALRSRWAPLRILLCGGALALALLVLQALVSPARADAILGLPDPAEIVKDGVKSSFDFVLKELFGGIPTKVTEAAVSWQLHLPSEAFSSSNVAELNRTTTAAAFALLSLVMTAAVLRLWLSGVLEGGAGGVEGITGFARGIAAALGVIAWPWAFDASIALVNSLTYELIHARSVHDDVSRMLGAAVGISLTGGPVGLLASIVVVVVGTLLMLGLFTLHIVLASALVVMFVGGPLLIVLAPFPGTAWMSALAFRAFTSLLAWPVIWAICFASFAAVFNDFVTFRGDGGVLDKALIAPLTGVAMLWLCVRLPLLATKASMLGLAGAGTLGFAARYFAVRQIGAQLGAGGDGTATPNHRAGGVGSTATASAADAATPSAGRTQPRPTPTSPATDGIAGAPPQPSPSPDPQLAAKTDDALEPVVAASSAPASLQPIDERRRELEGEMQRDRRRAGAPGQPASKTDADVAHALQRLGSGNASKLGNVYDRAIAAGRNRDEAMAAVTRASAIGAARAEGAPEAFESFKTVGSSPTHAFASGLELYRSEHGTEGSPPSAGSARIADRPPMPVPRPSGDSQKPGGVT